MELIEGLQRYSDECNLRFHMPGHKGKKETLKRISENIHDYDVTELSGTDNLHKPIGIIKNTQKRIAETYGVKDSYKLVNGTTSGIISAILACTKPKEKILIQRDSHKSVFSGAILGDLELEYIYPKYNEEFNLNVSIDLIELEKKLKENDDIKAVVLTYPTYYGICCDIGEAARIIHKHNKILIIDEAHGSHLNFVEALPIGAENTGSDIVIQSTHKTLPALTQSSVLHVCSKKINKEKLQKILAMIQSSSPSYILMSSVENAVEYMEIKGKERLNKNIEIIRTKTMEAVNKGIKIITKDIVKEIGGFDFDETKILISLEHVGISGSQLEKILRDKYKIQVEMSDMTYINAFVTAADEPNEIIKLFDSVINIFELNKQNIKRKKQVKICSIPKLEKAISIRRAFNEESKKIELNNSCNNVSADFIVPYPPGIPLVCPGEIISKEIINILTKLIENDINIIGINDNFINIIK